MKIITKKELEMLRGQYKPGSRVQLIDMNDPYCKILQPGAIGTVVAVDAVGTIHVKWDCGSHLGVVFGIDHCRLWCSYNKK